MLLLLGGSLISMGIKVYFCYDGDSAEGIQGGGLGREPYNPKITIPDSWLSGPCQKLVSFFVTTYNKKFPGKELLETDLKLRVGDVELPPTGIVSQFVQEHNDLHVEHKPVPKEVASVPPGSVVCGNFGCGKRYIPAENTDTSCSHHAQGPVFHDTAKYWACCPGQKAMDWEEFEAIPKCRVGPHAPSERPVAFSSSSALLHQALSPAQADAITNAQSSADVGPRRTGPREFEEAAQTAQGEVAADGTARCRNHGCGKRFTVKENHEDACVHHTAGPVFWDTYKYWKCCPDKKHIDFDDFAKVEGCARGPHKL